MELNDDDPAESEDEVEDDYVDGEEDGEEHHMN